MKVKTVGIGLVCLLLLVPTTGYAMGWLEKKLQAGDDRARKNLDASMPLIKAQADQILVKLGHTPASLSFAVFATGEGEEVWTVKYWSTPPKEYIDQVARHADLEVYLNNRGHVKRVVKYEGKQEQLLYGKDEQIPNGMSQEQVRERLGNPDYIGPVPQRERDIGDEEWRYNKNSDRTMRIEIWFKDKKVVWIGYFG